MRLLLVFSLIIFSSNVYSAEFLVRANQPDNAIQDYGDVVIVRPDGHVWGNVEKLPYYIVVKVPGVTVEAVKAWEGTLQKQTGTDAQGNPIFEMQKRRKFKVPTAWMNSVVSKGNDVYTVTLSAQKTAFINNIVEKVAQ